MLRLGRPPSPPTGSPRPARLRSRARSATAAARSAGRWSPAMVATRSPPASATEPCRAIGSATTAALRSTRPRRGSRWTGRRVFAMRISAVTAGSCTRSTPTPGACSAGPSARAGRSRRSGHGRACPRPWPGSRPAETMHLEPLYRARFTTPEAWSVELAGPAGTEGQSFLIAEGRCQGRLSGRLRGANYPRQRTDNALVPDFRGVLQTADGAAVLFAWHGYARAGAGAMRELVGGVTHVSGDERYRWLNDVVCALTGEVRPRSDGSGSDVEYDVAELLWEPLA